jgi:surface protein
MGLRYGNKVDPLVARKSNFYRKNRFDSLNIKRPVNDSTGSSTPWTRPAEWLTMPSFAPNEQKIAMLVPIYSSGSNYLSFTIAGNYTVNWGDGSAPENYTSGTRCQKEYDFANPNLSTQLTVDGAKMAIAIVTPQAGQNITSANFNQKFALAGLGTIPDTSPIIELVISAPSMTALTLGNIIASSVFCKNLVSFRGLNLAGMTSFGGLFTNCISLRSCEFGVIGNINSTFTMFQGCAALTNVPLFNTAAVTSMSFMFSSCAALTTVPLFNTAAVTNMNSMFGGCRSLTTVPLFDTSAVTNMSSMFFNSSSFIGCTALTTVPLFNTAAVTNMSSMFTGCTALITVPLLNTASVTDMNGMFGSCQSLTTVPLFNTAAVTNMNSMFGGCTTLTTVPLFNTAAVTNMNSMFSSCQSLTTVPLFNTAAVTNMGNMFNNCPSLTTVPLFNTAAVTNMSSMFGGCQSLTTVPLFNTASVNTMSSMFNGCSALTIVPLFNTQSVTTMSNMLANCRSLISVPLFNTSVVTSMGSMFSNCVALTTVPLFNTVAATDVFGMFQSCSSLRTVNFDQTGAGTSPTKFSSIFSGCSNLSRGRLGFAEYSVSYASCNLSRTALEEIMIALDTIGAASQTLTITGNAGSPTPIATTASSAVAAGATVIPVASTANLAIGMQVTGTGTPLTTGRAVTFTDTGDLVTLSAHGLQNGDEISFSVITTTTGIVINRIYYVVNAATNTFQVAATVGGAAINLVTNGTGTVRYNPTITAIGTGNVTISRPTGAIASAAALSFRQLKTATAIFKGWAITG